ncbi:MAG TPA: hypothetical protein PLU72_09935 [Candidatus Ozemobacteraceae bacterium]|nr:hypothetical protein [Candidatus Ozemobacteraceae bacterium]HQG27204.1 hypothetical protein [Candidatus Ozemobacteraceae bacterium]
MSCLFALVLSWFFLKFGMLFAAALVYFKGSPGYALAAAGIFLFSFVWQLRAARFGCLMPIFIFGAFLASESVVVCLALHEAGAFKNVDFTEARRSLEKNAPGLLEFGRRLFNAGSNLAKGRIGLGDARIAELEEAFRRNPGSPDAVLALADAYMAKNDLPSVRLATALYEALVETDPCDAFLARLADAYARMFRFDLAFATAARRTWQPDGGFGKAARQLAWLAAASGDLSRGIFELERILRQNPSEPEEVMLLLAGLYDDVGNRQQARVLLDRIIAETPAALNVAKTAAAMRQKMGN